jgi:hypothetical protein
VTGRQGRRRRKLLDDLKETRGYRHLKKESLDRTMWRARFGRSFGPVVRQTGKWMCIPNISTLQRYVPAPNAPKLSHPNFMGSQWSVSWTRNSPVCIKPMTSLISTRNLASGFCPQLDLLVLRHRRLSV